MGYLIYKWIFRNIGVAQNKTYLQMTEKYILIPHIYGELKFL